MIERYSNIATARQMAERFSVDEPIDYKQRFNAGPSQLLPIIIHEGKPGFSYFYWGMPPTWIKNKTLAEKVINVRAETIKEKPLSKKNMMQHRCLVAADGFYAWKKVGKKTIIPWRFVLKSKDLVSFAGLWEEYDDPDGNTYQTFTLITVPANGLVGTVTDRMPVIFVKNEEAVWLNPKSTEEELLSLLIPFDADKLDCYTVSHELNTISFDRPSLLIPTPPADQFGNLTLFD